LLTCRTVVSRCHQITAAPAGAAGARPLPLDRWVDASTATNVAERCREPPTGLVSSRPVGNAADARRVGQPRIRCAEVAGRQATGLRVADPAARAGDSVGELRDRRLAMRR